MPDDDRVLVNTQLVLHEGQPDGAKNRNYYYHCSSPSVSNLRAVIGSGMFSRRQVNPGISFSRLAAQPYLSIYRNMDSQFFFFKIRKPETLVFNFIPVRPTYIPCAIAWHDHCFADWAHYKAEAVFTDLCRFILLNPGEILKYSSFFLALSINYFA